MRTLGRMRCLPSPHLRSSVSVGEGLAPPAVYAPRPIFALSRWGRRPRRPVCPTFYHVRGRPRAAAPTTKANGLAPTRRGRRPRRPADSHSNPRPYSRRGRRPRRPVCPTFYHVRGRPRAAAPTTETNDLSQSRRGRRPRRPADTHPPHGLTPVGGDALDGPLVRHFTMSAGGRGRSPLRRKRTAWRPPVGDDVLDIPQIRTQTHGLTPVGADAPGGPSVRHSTMSAGGRGRPPLPRKRTTCRPPIGSDAPAGPFVRHSTMSAGGRGRPPLRRKRTASHHPAGDGVLDVPQIRTRTHGLTPVGADAPGGA